MMLVMMITHGNTLRMAGRMRSSKCWNMWINNFTIWFERRKKLVFTSRLSRWMSNEDVGGGGGNGDNIDPVWAAELSKVVLSILFVSCFGPQIRSRWCYDSLLPYCWHMGVLWMGDGGDWSWFREGLTVWVLNVVAEVSPMAMGPIQSYNCKEAMIRAKRRQEPNGSCL